MRQVLSKAQRKRASFTPEHKGEAMHLVGVGVGGEVASGAGDARNAGSRTGFAV
jgi:hypothetical protein